MLCLLAILIISKVEVMTCMLGAPGVPIPGSEMISQMFAKRVKIEGSLMNYVKNPNFNDTDKVEFADDNLDISVLDMNNFRRLINLSKKRNDENFRRQAYFGEYVTKKNRLQTAGYKTHMRENPSAYARDSNLIKYDRHIEKIFQMMKQSIYVVRDRVGKTKKIRAYFSEDPGYKIALLDSSIQHYLRKMDFFSRRVAKNYNREHFLWYLILYEKVLQCNIDINYAVERTFKINRARNQVMAGRPRIPKAMAVDQDVYKQHLSTLNKETMDKMKEDQVDKNDLENSKT